jgi:uncharacterized protein
MARAPDTHAWRTAHDGVMLRILLTPRASRDGVDGLSATPDGPVLRARVRAVPEDGKANAALEVVIADWLGLGRRAVAVTGGQTSRHKSVTVKGHPGDLVRSLTTKIAAIQES